MTYYQLKDRLRLPVIAAPMLLVSGTRLAIAACRAGVVGSFPSLNARSSDEFRQWMVEVSEALHDISEAAPYAVNLIIRAGDRAEEDLKIIEEFRVPLVITSVGNPSGVVDRVHGYGGLVFHDVATMRHAEKAMAAGVDGLILLSAGSGGHTGSSNPFAFVRLVRQGWDGAIILAGGISDGHAVRAAETLGADFAYLGTRFAATEESLAAPDYKRLLVEQSLSDVVTTDRISGLSATFMRGSIAAVGLDPDNLPPAKGLFDPDLPESIKAWRDVWSAGHGVGSISDVPPVGLLVDRMVREYRDAGGAKAAARDDGSR